MPAVASCKGTALWCWAISDEGTAIATWGSDILSLVAICIALAVFLVEQRRFNTERLASGRREDERANRFIDAAIQIASSMRTETDRLFVEAASTDGMSDIIELMRHYTSHIRVSVDAVWIFRHKAPDDPDIALALARMQRAGEVMLKYGENGTFPNAEKIRDRLAPYNTELGEAIVALERERRPVPR